MPVSKTNTYNSRMQDFSIRGVVDYDHTMTMLAMAILVYVWVLYWATGPPTSIIISNNNEQDKIYKQRQEKEKTTGSVEGVPNSNNTSGRTLRQKSNKKNMEPTPRAGHTIPSNQMSKTVGPRTNHSVGT